MGKVIIGFSMSLDGFIDDRNGSVELDAQKSGEAERRGPSSRDR